MRAYFLVSRESLYVLIPKIGQTPNIVRVFTDMLEHSCNCLWSITGRVFDPGNNQKCRGLRIWQY